MEPLVSIVGSVAGKVAEYTVGPIGRQLSYLFKHKSKVQNLRDKGEELKHAEERVQQSVREAKRKGERFFVMLKAG
ncbi:hypothetical protein J1N35_022936 [Gossypium stocksii]|uniref:Uncharacterized protein n=1 Tax=Gossypium stocksii TaxID=47602 RepID=A0A9D3VHD7_9ROSI|nr:hypothetical protein J1N35_022936 [Gossypium stocksii]